MKSLGKRILWQRALDYIRRYKPLLIGVTGSAGKTMVKDAIELILQDTQRVRTAPKSYNTPIGIALTILGINKKTPLRHWVKLLAGSYLRERIEREPDIIILELGADRPGDIDYLAKQLPFSIGVVTNTQSTHLRLFTSLDMVAHEQTSLVVTLPKDGTAILNADDVAVLNMQDHTKAKTILFGESERANIRLLRTDRRGDSGFACELLINGAHHELHLPHLVAKYQINHALAALGVALAVQENIKHAIRHVQSLKPPPGRMRLLAGHKGAKLLDDSYSASPESTLAALNTLKELPAKRRLAILGDMLDLGAEAIPNHRSIGAHAADVANVFVAVGDNMRHAGAAALKAGDTDVHHFPDSKDVGKWLHDFLQPTDLVLIKGSRDMKMEEVTKRLLANPTDTSQLVH